MTPGRPAACAVLLLSVAAIAAPLELRGPARVLADGETATRFEVLGLPASVPATALGLAADHGLLRVAAGVEAPGVVTLELLPPRLVRPATAQLSVTVPGRRRPLRLAVALDPFVPPVTLTRREGPLSLEAPDGLVLGQVREARLSFAPPEAAPGEVPLVQVNVGTVSPPRLGVGGRYEVDYTPPTELFPQVAIVVVSDAAGNLLDWTSFPLEGEGSADVTSEPGSMVEVLVAGTRYGPVRADASGVVSLWIVVPPGAADTRARVTDVVGNEHEEPLELELPAYQQMIALCPPSADRVRIIGVDRDGRPLAEPALAWFANRGELTATAQTAPGVYEAAFTAPEDAEVGDQIDVGAALPGPESVPARCALTVRAGRATQLAVRTALPAYIAGSGGVVELLVTASDAEGRPATAPGLALAADVGEVSRPRSAGLGRYAARWQLPDRFEGRERAVVRATMASAPAIEGEATLPLRPGTLTAVVVTFDPPRLQSPDDPARLLISAADPFDNAISDAQWQVTSRGRVEELRFDPVLERHVGIWRRPMGERIASDRVQVREVHSGLGAEARLEVPLPGVAVEVMPRIGFTTNLARHASPTLGAELALKVPTWTQALSLAVTADAARSAWRLADLSGTEQIQASLWVIPVMGNLRYRLPLGSFGVSLGAGAGAALYQRSVSSPRSGTVERAGAQLAFGGQLGADWRLGMGRLTVELSLLRTGIEGATGLERTNLFGVITGYRMEL